MRVKTVADVSLGAIAEFEEIMRPRRESRRPSLIYIKWSASVKAATIVSGRLHNANGKADAFLHTLPPEALRTSAPESPTCPICERPCIASFASLDTIIRDTNTVGDDSEQRAAELLKSASQDPAGPEANRLQAAAQALGVALGQASNAILPDHIILGGAFMPGSDIDFNPDDGIRKGLTETIAPPARRTLGDDPVAHGRLTGEAALAGAKIIAWRAFGGWATHRRYMTDSREKEASATEA